MAIFGKLRNTWRLMGSSWRLLMLDKELLLFPVLSSLACVLVVLSYVVPIAVFATGSPGSAPVVSQNNPIIYFLLFMFYFMNYFVITFFNVAIISGAIERMRGGDPTFESCLKAAIGRLPQILGWAFAAATVGMILRIIEERSAKLGAFIAGFLGSAWTVATFLVVPLIVVERAGPIDAFTRSTALLKKTWGENLTAGASFGLLFFLLSVPGVLLAFAAILAFTAGSGFVGAIVGMTAAIYLVALSLIQSALYSIFQASLYVYAEGGIIPETFDRETLVGVLN